MKILVIEDNNLHRGYAKEVLEADHDVVCVETFDEAIGILTDKEKMNFDVVLSDLMMPSSTYGLSGIGMVESKNQTPYGFVLALQSALAGVKYIAVVTDTNHHDSPLSHSLDYIHDAYYRDSFKPNFNINGAKVMFVHAPSIVVKTGEFITCDWCDGSRVSQWGGECPGCNGNGQREVELYPKNWLKVFTDLTS